MSANDEAVRAAAEALAGIADQRQVEAAVAAAAPILLAAERQRIAEAIRAHAEKLEGSGWGRAVEFRTAARIAEASP